MLPNRAFIEGSPQVSVTVPAQTSISDTAGIVLIANAKRKGIMIQNTGTTVIKITYGTVLPTQTVYHLALMAASGADDGSGGVLMESSWVGQVNAISSVAGGTCAITELMSGLPDWDRAGDWGLR